MSEERTPGALGSNDVLGPSVKSALLDPACQRLRDWALIGPVQRAEIESFAERLLAAERERCAKLCEERADYAADVICDEAERRSAQDCADAIRRA